KTEQYPERYIFLLLFFVAFSRLVKALKRYRRDAEVFHQNLGELDIDGSSEISRPQSAVSSEYYPYAYTINIPNASFNVDDLLHVPEHPNFETNEAVARPPYLTPRNTPSLPTEILNAHRIHHLLLQLQTALSSAQNEPEDSGSSHRRRVKVLRRQLSEAMRINVESASLDDASRPPLDSFDPPPAYSDISPILEGGVSSPSRVV
ncbi:hypothetical protein CPB84DRAFT_1783992, partial [Gymnopilus junonius]